jgi:hypothetical protein
MRLWSTNSRASLAGRPARPPAVNKRWVRCQNPPGTQTLFLIITIVHDDQTKAIVARSKSAYWSPPTVRSAIVSEFGRSSVCRSHDETFTGQVQFSRSSAKIDDPKSEKPAWIEKGKFLESYLYTPHRSMGLELAPNEVE